MIEVRTIRITWFVETGYCDGGGIGIWDGTEESVPCDTEAEANDLRDEWLNQGKLHRTHWGEIRPVHDYGMFRIRRHEEILVSEAGDVRASLEMHMRAKGCNTNQNEDK